MSPLPEPLLALLDQQWGAIARRQVLEHVPRGVVDGLVQRGALVALHRGVYRVRGGATPAEQALMAAWLRAGSGAIVTGPAVLGLFDVDGFTPADRFEVLLPRDRGISQVSFPWRREPEVGTPRATFGALPIATPAAAFVDACRLRSELGDRRLRVGLDSGRWRRLFTTSRVVERARLLGAADPGAAVVLDWLDAGAMTSESEPERRVAAVLGRFDPPPEAQVWVTARRRVDFFFRLLRLALEYLGSVDHGTAAAMLRDRDREDELAAVGISVVPIVRADLDDVDGLVAWLAHVVAARAYELDVPAPRLR